MTIMDSLVVIIFVSDLELLVIVDSLRRKDGEMP